MSANWNRFIWSLLATCALVAVAMTAAYDAYASPEVAAIHTATPANMAKL
jgi:hypothetical protein